MASETVTFGYDALGRLVRSTTAGGPNNAVATATCFDRAGNRKRYAVGAGAAACGATPTSTSTPASGNQPPVAVADSVSGPCNSVMTFDVVANDHDPDGNTPLNLTSVTGSANVTADVVSGTSIQFTGSAPGTDSLSYIVQDSLGATAIGTITYRTTGTQSTCYR